MILSDTPEWAAAVRQAAEAYKAEQLRQFFSDDSRDDEPDDVKAMTAALPFILQGVARLVRENYHNIDEGLSIADFIARIAEGK